MDRGFSSVVAKLAELDGSEPPGRVLVTAGSTLVSTVGGASGPLWGTALRRAGRALGDAEPDEAQERDHRQDHRGRHLRDGLFRDLEGGAVPKRGGGARGDAELYSLILANPPFAGSLDYESTAKDLQQIVKTKKTELLFLALFLRLGALPLSLGLRFGRSRCGPLLLPLLSVHVHALIRGWLPVRPMPAAYVLLGSPGPEIWYFALSLRAKGALRARTRSTVGN